MRHGKDSGNVVRNTRAARERFGEISRDEIGSTRETMFVACSAIFRRHLVLVRATSQL